MKILMVTTDFPPTVGGISAHVFELAKAMVQAGHQVSVLSRRHAKAEPARETLAGIQVFRMTYWPPGLFYGLQIRRQVKALLPELQPDIVHIHAMRPLEWYDITAVPLAYTNHTSGYLKRLRKGGARRLWQLKRLFAKPRLFLAPSRELLETPFAVPGKKLFIPNGVDAQRYQRNPQVRAQLRRELGIADDERLCVITRRLVWKNGVIFLAQASEFVTDPKVKFLVIGDGPEREAVANCTTTLFSTTAPPTFPFCHLLWRLPVSADLKPWQPRSP
jgi:glycosyltransferase involved in cell wall biosynthesis